MGTGRAGRGRATRRLTGARPQEGRCYPKPYALTGAKASGRMSHCRVPASASHHNGAFTSFLPMVSTLAPTLAGLRLAAFAQVPQSCARVLRHQRTRRHGVPTAFVSLSGVTAMLSAAVRKV